MSWNWILYNNIIPLSSRVYRVYMNDIIHHKKFCRDISKKNKSISSVHEINKSQHTSDNPPYKDIIYNYKPNIIIE
jgi:hypothetical protein